VTGAILFPDMSASDDETVSVTVYGVHHTTTDPSWRHSEHVHRAILDNLSDLDPSGEFLIFASTLNNALNNIEFISDGMRRVRIGGDLLQLWTGGTSRPEEFDHFLVLPGTVVLRYVFRLSAAEEEDLYLHIQIRIITNR
jgi:hypothetical protein